MGVGVTLGAVLSLGTSVSANLGVETHQQAVCNDCDYPNAEHTDRDPVEVLLRDTG